jgi:hypothetical protein
MLLQGGQKQFNDAAQARPRPQTAKLKEADKKVSFSGVAIPERKGDEQPMFGGQKQVLKAANALPVPKRPISANKF